MNIVASEVLLDIRPVQPRDRHRLVLSTFSNLGAGASMEIVVDRDPLPLHDALLTRWPGTFGWNYLEQGPDTWRIGIVKLDLPHGGGTCCGSCGGG